MPVQVRSLGGVALGKIKQVGDRFVKIRRGKVVEMPFQWTGPGVRNKRSFRFTRKKIGLYKYPLAKQCFRLNIIVERELDKEVEEYMALTQAEIDWARYELELAVDDSCIDNWRFAEVGDEEEEAVFAAQSASGCCGSYENTLVHPNGKRILAGCNYGH